MSLKDALDIAHLLQNLKPLEYKGHKYYYVHQPETNLLPLLEFCLPGYAEILGTSGKCLSLGQPEKNDSKHIYSSVKYS